jgi:hypothetical protein
LGFVYLFSLFSVFCGLEPGYEIGNQQAESFLGFAVVKHTFFVAFNFGFEPTNQEFV